MKGKRYLAKILAAVLVFSIVQAHLTFTMAGNDWSVEARDINGENQVKVETQSEGGGTEPGGGETEPEGGETEPGGGETEPGGGETEPGGGETEPGGGETEPGGIVNLPVVSEISVGWNGGEEPIVLRYEIENDFDYVDIFVDGKEAPIELNHKEPSYCYEYEDWEKGKKDFVFTVVPYKNGKKGTPGTSKSYHVEYAKAVIRSIYVDYDLERQVLYVDWEGEHIKTVNVYLDGSDKPLEGTYIDNEGDWVASLKLEPRSTHELIVVPVNDGNEEGDPAQPYKLLVDDYEAKITDYTIDYNEETRRLEMKWESIYAKYVSIYLNDEELVENCKENSFAMDCVLQPGASYIVSIMPYNGQDEEGEELEEDISFGEFEVPDEFSASVMKVDMQDAAGNYTGFTKPLIKLQWEAQKQAVYEIYRAEKDKRSAYTWIATVRADKEEVYTYIDEKAGFGDYYYKIRRKIVMDDYLEQELYTALSDAEHVRVLVPRPKIKVKLSTGRRILLTMSSRKGYVSGYEIYRKRGGKYEKIASTTDNKYVDKDIKFGKTYSYKVRAYYYDVKAGKKIFGKYSKVSSVKNTMGAIKAEAVAVSSDTVKLSWTKAVNADTYEIYGKSGTVGDSYVLLATTKQLSLKYKLKQNIKYFFVIKAYQAKDENHTYFSSAEVSIQTGFSAPRGLKLAKTVHKKDKDVFVQEDTLSWNRVYGAKGYYVEVYDAKEKEYVRVVNVRKGSKTSCTISNPVTAEAKALTYRVSAYLGKRVEKGDTIKIKPQLGAVKKVKAAKNGEKVKVSWKKAEGAERYKVYRSNGSAMFVVGETDQTSIVDKGLSAGISYSYYVQTVNHTLKLTGAMSEPVTCKMPQGKVSGLKAVNTAGGNVQLKWKAAKSAQKYVIYYKGSEDKEYKELKRLPADATSYVHKKQERGTLCSYKVVAVQKNSGGVWVESKPAQAKVRIKK